MALMAAEGWQHTRDGVVALWRRFRPEAAETVAGDLDTARQAIVAAAESGDREILRRLRANWQMELGLLLAAHPEAEAELRALLERAGPPAGGGQVVGDVRLEAHATDHGRNYLAVGDQHITER